VRLGLEYGLILRCSVVSTNREQASPWRGRRWLVRIAARAVRFGSRVLPSSTSARSNSATARAVRIRRTCCTFCLEVVPFARERIARTRRSPHGSSALQFHVRRPGTPNTGGHNGRP